MTSHPAKPVVKVTPQIREDAEQGIFFASAGLTLDHSVLPLRQAIKHGGLHCGGRPGRHACSHIAGVCRVSYACGILGILDGS
ncbi:hypothetical protein D3C76_1597770 [compost metagenome]